MLRIALVAALFAGLPAWEVVAQDKLTVKFKGKTADQWAALLVDTDFDTSMLAAQALGSIGAEALPFIPPAFKVDVPFVQTNAISSVGEGAVEANRKEATRILMMGLKSRYFGTQQSAIQRLTYFSMVEALPEVRAMAAAETNDVKSAILRKLLAEFEAKVKKP